MYLIEYSDGLFINGEDINWISVRPEKIKFTLKGDSSELGNSVDKSFQRSFINSLQAIDKNSDIERKYMEANKIFTVQL